MECKSFERLISMQEIDKVTSGLMGVLSVVT